MQVIIRLLFLSNVSMHLFTSLAQKQIQYSSKLIKTEKLTNVLFIS